MNYDRRWIQINCQWGACAWSKESLLLAASCLMDFSEVFFSVRGSVWLGVELLKSVISGEYNGEGAQTAAFRHELKFGWRVLLKLKISLPQGMLRG